MTATIVNGKRTRLWTPPKAKITPVNAADVQALPHLAHLWLPGVVMQGHKIQWCCESWNAWVGCTHTGQKICELCYPEQMDYRFQYDGYTHWGSGIKRHPVSENQWHKLYIWNERVKATGHIHPNEGKTVFPDSASDWMDIDPGVPQGSRERLLRTMEETPYLIYLPLTKRPHLFKKLLPRRFAYSHSHVMLGMSVDSQRWLNFHLEDLFAVEAAGYFLSIEGRSEPIDLTAALKGINGRRVTWVQDGGASDQYNRKEHRLMEGYPFDVAWARSTIRQCREFGAYPFIKQLGSRVWDGDRQVVLKDSHGGDMLEWGDHGYEDIMVRELAPMLTD